MEIILTDQNFEKEVLQSDLPVLVDFWAEWCAPCRAVGPVVEELAKDFDGKLKVGKVNAPLNRMLCARLRVLSMPTFILYKDGIENKRLTGEKIKPAELKSAVEALLV